jgi:putative phosphoribosyl transferase
MQFKDRKHAGTLLADRLLQFEGRPDVILLALPPGGVPVAAAAADVLGVHLDVLVMSALGIPERDELAFGAVCSCCVGREKPIMDMSQIPEETLEYLVAAEQEEVLRREIGYRGHGGDLNLRGMKVILVDDGFTSAAFLTAAADVVRQLGASRVIAAMPVAPLETLHFLEDVCDDVVTIVTTGPLDHVGEFYEDRSSPTDDEVRSMLAEVHG